MLRLLILITVLLAGCTGQRDSIVASDFSSAFLTSDDVSDLAVDQDAALGVAEQALAAKLGPTEYRERWLRREYLSASATRQDDQVRWTVLWRAPIEVIAGGAGEVELDASTGEVLRVHIPDRQR